MGLTILLKVWNLEGFSKEKMIVRIIKMVLKVFTGNK